MHHTCTCSISYVIVYMYVYVSAMSNNIVLLLKVLTYVEMVQSLL